MDFGNAQRNVMTSDCVTRKRDSSKLDEGGDWHGLLEEMRTMMRENTLWANRDARSQPGLINRMDFGNAQRNVMTSDCVTRKRDSSKQRSFGHSTVINNPYNDEYSAGSPERLISLQSFIPVDKWPKGWILVMHKGTL
jgi:hypothetical protein